MDELSEETRAKLIRWRDLFKELRRLKASIEIQKELVANSRFLFEQLRNK
jgi:hypothetical protein